MCEMDRQRKNVLANIGLEIGTAVQDIRAMRKVAEGLRIKDLDILDKLDKAMMEAANYLADELEASQ